MTWVLLLWMLIILWCCDTRRPLGIVTVYWASCLHMKWPSCLFWYIFLNYESAVHKFSLAFHWHNVAFSYYSHCSQSTCFHQHLTNQSSKIFPMYQSSGKLPCTGVLDSCFSYMIMLHTAPSGVLLKCRFSFSSSGIGTKTQCFYLAARRCPCYSFLVHTLSSKILDNPVF